MHATVRTYAANRAQRDLLIEESNRVARDWIATNLRHLEVGAPQVAAGDVVVPG